MLVGISFFVLTFLTVKTFAPQANSNARKQTATHNSNSWSMSMSNEDSTTINIVPTSSQVVYTAVNNIKVTNSCSAGATITMTTDSTASNDLVSGSSPNNKLTATTTSALDNYTWGYSLDNGSTYSAVPKKGQTAAVIYNGTAAQTTALDIPITFGVKTDNHMYAGAYSNDIVFTMTPKSGCIDYEIIWNFDNGTPNPNASYPASILNQSTMDLTQITPTRQGYVFNGWSNGSTTFTGSETAANINPTNASQITMTALWIAVPSMQSFSCSSLTVGDTTTLRDTRNQNTYGVVRATGTDNLCWMTQNLRLVEYTLTSADSNVTSDFTIPESYVHWGAVDDTSGFNNPKVYYNTNSAGDDSVFYNYAAVSAGTITGSENTDEAVSSVCPKGWRLPTKDEWTNLFNDYSFTNNSAGATLARQSPLSLNYSGYHAFYSSTIYSANAEGRWWSSTASSESAARYNAVISMYNVYANNAYNRRSGLAVRCVSQ